MVHRISEPGRYLLHLPPLEGFGLPASIPIEVFAGEVVRETLIISRDG